MRAEPIGTVLDLRTANSQKCEAVPRRARIEGSKTLYHSTPGSKVIKQKKRTMTFEHHYNF